LELPSGEMVPQLVLVLPKDHDVDVQVLSRYASEEQVKRPAASDVPRLGEPGEQGG
jgi:hypothetical protein